MVKIIIMGVQGSGKGTHGAVVAKRYNIPIISTGELFRKNISDNTPLGQLAKTYIDKGNLVPDEVTVDMLKERLCMDDCQNGYILDGFPRTINQAKLLDNVTKIDIVLCFELPDEEARDRMLGRRTCSKCNAIYHTSTYDKDDCQACGGKLFIRDDDKEHAINKRLENYHKQTAPLKEYYKDKIQIIDMMGEVEENKLKIAKVMDNFDKEILKKPKA